MMRLMRLRSAAFVHSIAGICAPPDRAGSPRFRDGRHLRRSPSSARSWSVRRFALMQRELQTAHKGTSASPARRRSRRSTACMRAARSSSRGMTKLLPRGDGHRQTRVDGSRPDRRAGRDGRRWSLTLARIGERSSRRMACAATNVSGAGATITADGNRSGRQMAGDSHAAVSGACGKAQPPATGEPFHSGIVRERARRDLILCVAVVLVVVGIAAKEFGGKLRAIESA